MSGVIAELDVLVGFATVVSTMEGFVRPTMLERGSGIIRMTASRHPLVECGTVSGDDVRPNASSFIPNDVEMIHGQSHCQIITGPNAGGKSTYIRQVATCCLLAQIGMYTPATSATLTIVDAILCRIGAGDSQSKGVSTFMQEMLETAQILHLATSDSLVVVDEMGRGTSVEDGLGLAWATAERIGRRGSFALFATHFAEMNALEEERIGIVNKHVTAMVVGGRLEYLYEVKDGASEESFGVECMEMAGFDERIVEGARVKLEEFERERRGGGERSGVMRRVEGLREKLRRMDQLTGEEREQEKKRIRVEAQQLQTRLSRLT